MKKILFSITLFFTFNCFTQTQTTSFQDWYFTEHKNSLIIGTDSGKSVKNCDFDSMALDLMFGKTGNKAPAIFTGENLYTNYEGEDIMVEMIIKDSSGNYSDRISFTSDNWKGDSGKYFLQILADNQPINNFLFDYFVGDKMDEDPEDVFIQTTFKNEVKVFKFSLKGFKASLLHLGEMKDKFENPFDN